MAAVFAFHAGKPVVQITAIEITIDHLLDIGPPESVMTGKLFLIDLDKGFKIVLYAAVIIRILRAAGPVFAGGQRPQGEEEPAEGRRIPSNRSTTRFGR